MSPKLFHVYKDDRTIFVPIRMVDEDLTEYIMIHNVGAPWKTRLIQDGDDWYDNLITHESEDLRSVVSALFTDLGWHP